MKAVAYINPYDVNGHILLDVVQGQSLASIVRHEKLPKHYHEYCEVRIARKGKWVTYEDRAMWPHIHIKNKTLVMLMPRVADGEGSSIFMSLAAVALTFATAGIGAGIAAGAGVALQLASAALTPSPEKIKSPIKLDELKQAGIAINDVQRGEYVDAILGRIEYSPDHLIPPFVTLESGRVWVNAMYGFMGRCLVENVKVNSVAYAEISEIEVEIYEGTGSDGYSSLSYFTHYMDPVSKGIKLSNFRLSTISASEAELEDQLIPENSLPKWHQVNTQGIADEFIIRLALANALTAVDGTEMAVPVHVEIRESGTSTWKKLPVLHVRDFKQRGALRFDINLMWGKKSGRWKNNLANRHVYMAHYVAGSGQSFVYTADSYFDPTGVSNTDISPLMTSNVNGSIVTSASHNNADAWKALDGTTTAGWAMNSSDLPGWWQIDLGSGGADTYRRIGMQPLTNLQAANYNLLGSQDGATWTTLLEVRTKSTTELANGIKPHNLANDTAYRYYRIELLTSLGGSTVEIHDLQFYATNLSNAGNGTAVVSGNFANYVSIHDDGIDIFLDPAQGWTRGEYEVRVQRGLAYVFADLTRSASTYNYATVAADANFFTYSATGPYSVIRVQSYVNSDIVIDDCMTTIYERPIAESIEQNLTRIMVRAPEMELNSISATFTRYGRDWDGVKAWSFRNNLNGFVGANLTVEENDKYAILTASSSDPIFRSPSGLAIDGSKLSQIEVVLKRVSGSSWDGNCFYVTSGHAESASFYKHIDEPLWGSGWSTINFDMENLTAGGVDWIGNTITQLRFDFGLGAGDVFQVRSIAVKRSSTYSGIWVDEPVPTRNPAAHARDALLLSGNNAMPIPGEIIGDSSLEALWEQSAIEDMTCDAVVRGRSISDVIALLYSCARSSPRQSNMWGVVIDRNRSADPITAMLTPETSRNEGTKIVYEKVPHGLRASYLDEDDSYIEKEVVVYRSGFSSVNATDIISKSYEGITSFAKATTQAEYDLAQMFHRNIEYRWVCGRDGRFYVRGQKIGISDEFVHRHSYWGLIKEVLTSGSNVTGLVINGIARLSDSAEAISEEEGSLGTFGAAIRLKDSSCITAEIIETSDTDTITFSTPIDNTADLFAIRQPIGIGPLGIEVKNAILKYKEFIGNEQWRLILVPEANEIFD